MRTKNFFGVLVCLFIFGCVSFMYHELNYDIALAEVERPAEAKERYGEQKIFSTEEQGYKYIYEDELIKILWLPTSRKIGFFLTNKTNYSIRIIWDEAAYVDEIGESHRIIHSGVKYIDKEKPQPSSVVVRKGTLSDIIFPSDYVVYSDGWIEKPLLPTSQFGGDQQEFLGEARKYV